MTTTIVILLVVSALAETGGVILLVADTLRARRELRKPAEDIFIDGNPPPPGQTLADQLSRGERMALEPRLHPWWTVILLVLGIMTGLVANLLGVPWQD